jgi:hypothetical protein
LAFNSGTASSGQPFQILDIILLPNGNNSSTGTRLASGQPFRIDIISADIHGNNSSTATAAPLASGQPFRINY